MLMRFLFGLFGLVFVAAGVLTIYFVLVDPILTWQAAQSWTPTPCTIVESEVQAHHDDDGYTYSVHVKYNYEFDGQAFTSERYSISTGSSSGRSGKQKVVEGYPPGSEHTCYVDPGSPGDALLTRDFMWDTLFGLFGFLFLIPGLIVLAVAFWSGSAKPSPAFEKQRETFTQRLAEAPSDVTVEDVQTLPDYDRLGGPRDLETTSPWVNFWLILFAAGFWNGITWAIIWASWGDSPGWWFGCFLTPFVVIGLGLALAMVHSFLALFNPRPLLNVSSEAIRLGDRMRLQWSFRGRTSSIRHLRIVLIGKEHARFEQGTSTSTRDETFLEHVLFEGTGSHEVRSGSCYAEIPDHLVPSFEGGNNAIRYLLQVHGDIRMWPDVQADFPIVVLPHDYPQGGA